MSNERVRKRRLTLLRLICLVLLIPATLAWLVNLELSIRLQVPGWVFFENLMPAAFFQPLVMLGADLSTISTLVPFLLLAYPFVMAGRILRFGEDAPDRLRRLVYDPYPPHFPFFLVMLGLAGTLYGLLIGLEVSGVEDLGGQIASPESIQAMLDKLLGGTATALLSSLLGLAGAFLAARPLTWIFHRAALMPSEDEPFSLSDTLRHLIDDMQSLGDASRGFGERLGSTAIQDLPETLKDIRDELNGLREQLAGANQRIDSLGESQVAGQALLQPLTQLTELNRLASLEDLLTQLGTSQHTGNTHQEKLIELLDQGNKQQEQTSHETAHDMQALQHNLGSIEDVLREMKEQSRQGQDLLGEGVKGVQDLAERSESAFREADHQRSRLIELLQAAGQDRETDRHALRSAFGQFLQGNVKQPLKPDASSAGATDHEAS